MIYMQDVWYHIDKYPILSNINLRVKPGEFVYLVGASGAGKSTVLRLIHMELMPTRGFVKVADYQSHRIQPHEIPLFRRKVSVIFQDFKLLDDRDVYENVAFALWATGVPRRKIKKRVFHVLAEVGLSHRRYAMPSELSGGEKQRVAIARALANEPFVLLADEPTGNLDPESTHEIMQLLMRIHRKGTAVLMATHKETMPDTQYPMRMVRLNEGKIAS
ncbi:ATP-binding cassette domain-containing protein [bacterium]|nr:ATP-binding cassette domain-containing protein [bacterium]